jgi:predicted negative regulator of RcsB-dependent stress response
VDSYRTEEEQLEVLKRWWRENGTSTLLAVALALAVVFGWQAWRNHQASQQEAASAVYQNLLAAVEGEGSAMSSEQRATALHLADTLRKEYPDSAYASFAALFQARFAVVDKDLEGAEQALRWVVKQKASDQLAHVATLRLARVLAARGEFDAALALLADSPAGFGAAYAEARGDIHTLAGHPQQALEAYQQAQASSADAPQSPLLAMKLAELGAAGGG